ncbi:hypothetical protein CLU79DRAFT_751813 [Phycomyces nitens]|nr:hypothetical protein CLU79DRAFT_751813 [Phycomyces nitens]
MSSPVIIITGASRGIGRAATILALSKFNARVVAVARDESRLIALKLEAQGMGKGENLITVTGDVTKESVNSSAVDQALSAWGQLDGVIANAGVLEPVDTIANGSLEVFKHLFDVNFFSIIDLCQKALPHLRKTKGSIIMVSSGAALKGYRAWGAYGSSKAALNHLTNTLSVEEPEVTTIAIRPGVVDTEMQGLLRSVGKETMEDDYNKFVELYETGKLIKPEQPAHVMAALASKAPKELSGRFISWDDEILADYRS